MICRQAYRENINMEPPFGGKTGDPPPLSPSEIDDMIAFLSDADRWL